MADNWVPGRPPQKSVGQDTANAHLANIESSMTQTAMSVENALTATAYDLNAASYSGTTALTDDYRLDSIEFEFSTTQSRTITVTSSTGAKIYQSTNTYNTIVLQRSEIGQAMNANDNITIAVTQTAGACLMDLKLKIEKGNVSLGGNPTLGAGTNHVGSVDIDNFPTTQKTAFDEDLTAELTPVFQADFSYNVNSRLFNTRANGGTVTIDSNRIKIATAASANTSAYVATKLSIPYRAGQGGLVRFTRIFTTGVAGSNQYIGIGDVGDGFFFGYSGTTFGVLKRRGGAREVRTLTITTASSTNGNATITLDGSVATVPVTNSGVISTTANEIASYDYSNIGRGWIASSVGDGKVVFASFDSSSRTGTYSLSAATAVGTFAQTLAGAAPTEDFVAQADWNYEGETNPLPTMDWTKGNVFQIRYQWLGYGTICFYVENPNTGRFVCVHAIRYANANTLPSINNPSLPISMIVENTSNTTAITGYTASVAGFIEGKSNGGHIHNGYAKLLAYTSATEKPVVTIYNKEIYQGKRNRSRIKIVFIDVSAEGTKPVVMRVKLNPTLVGASYTDIGTDTSTVSYDTSATSSTGGTLQYAASLAKSDSHSFDIASSSFHLNPGEWITVTAESSANSDVTASFNWEEF